MNHAFNREAWCITRLLIDSMQPMMELSFPRRERDNVVTSVARLNFAYEERKWKTKNGHRKNTGPVIVRRTT